MDPFFAEGRLQAATELRGASAVAWKLTKADKNLDLTNLHQ